MHPDLDDNDNTGIASNNLATIDAIAYINKIGIKIYTEVNK